MHKHDPKMLRKLAATYRARAVTEPERARVLLNDRERLAKTSFEEWSSAFTLFIRAERFCDGYWGGAPETGEAAALMMRLEQLERNWDDSA